MSYLENSFYDRVLDQKQDKSPVLDELVSLPPMSNAMIHIDGTGHFVETPAYDFGVDLLSSQTALEARTKLGVSSGVTQQYVDDKIASLVASAPSTLDTLKELADALGGDSNFATTMATSLGNKVDKVSGKSLSENDFTNNLKTKLDSLPTASTLATSLSAKSDVGHSHAWGDITGKPSFAAVATSGSYADLSNKPTLFTPTSGAHIPNAPTNAPIDAAINAPADGKTDYNVLTTLLGTLVDGLNTTNSKQNQIANIVNANAAKQNTMGGIVNTIASKLNLSFTSLRANAILLSA